MLNFQLGLEQSSWDPGFDHNTVRDSGNVNGIRDLTATQETGFAKKTGLEKGAILGRAMTGVRDAGFSTGSGSHFPDPVSKDHTVVTPEDSKIQDWETERYKGENGRKFGTRDSPRDQGLPFQTLFQKITLVLKPEDH